MKPPSLKAQVQPPRAPAAFTIARADAWLREHPDWPAPRVTSNELEEVVFTWINGDRTLTISVPISGPVLYGRKSGNASYDFGNLLHDVIAWAKANGSTPVSEDALLEWIINAKGTP